MLNNPSPSGCCFHFNSCRNCSRTHKNKQSLTIRLLLPLQFLQKSLNNFLRHIQSSASLPSHLPKCTWIKHHHFGSDCGASATHRQCQTIFYHQAIASTSILAESLENFWRYFQSSASLPSHLPKYTSIKHRHFGSDCGTAAIHRQCQTIPHHQAIVSTLILAEIARELTQTHSSESLFSLLPNSSGSNSNGLEAIWCCHHHPPTMPNSPSLPGKFLYPNSHGKQ